MKRYVCSICGFIYDEAAGLPKEGIPQKTTWDSLPDTWVCPLCKAPKSEFRPEGASSPSPAPKPAVFTTPEEEKELGTLEISALCSNLAKGCEKQYMNEEAALFTQLSDYFKAAAAPAPEPSAEELLRLIETDLEEGFPAADAVSSEERDRGALRALVWSQKVTRILKSLLARYEAEGDAMLEHTGVYVCTICGFVYVGDTPPDLCPVCKVASWKFEKIEGRN